MLTEDSGNPYVACMTNVNYARCGPDPWHLWADRELTAALCVCYQPDVSILRLEANAEALRQSSVASILSLVIFVSF